jgi:predicted nucleic acid-binding protein
MTLVIDASVAIKWFVEEHDSERAERVLQSSQRLCAPELLLVEVANALWKNAARATIAPDHARQAQSCLPRSIDLWRSTGPLLGEAVQLALAFNHPIYDMVYVALARELGSRVVTADQRLTNKAAGTPMSDWVVPLADWRPE